MKRLSCVIKLWGVIADKISSLNAAVLNSSSFVLVFWDIQFTLLTQHEMKKETSSGNNSEGLWNKINLTLIYSLALKYFLLLAYGVEKWNLLCSVEKPLAWRKIAESWVSYLVFECKVEKVSVNLLTLQILAMRKFHIHRHTQRFILLCPCKKWMVKTWDGNNQQQLKLMYLINRLSTCRHNAQVISKSFRVVWMKL